MKNLSRQKDCPYLELIARGQAVPAGHAEDCEVCRELKSIVSVFPARIDVEIWEPTAEALRRHGAIPTLVGKGSSIVEVSGTVAFDSWRQLAGRRLRDPGPGAIRRIRMEGAGTSLELFARRLRGVWEMTARVYEDSRPSVRWILYAGRRKLIPGVLGFYHWSSKSIPRLFRLRTSAMHLRFERNE